MGIQGLIPFVKDATETVHLKVLSGKTVAVDSYCWLHKGAFGCAHKLAVGEATDAYVKYCMNLINMLLEFKITPIMVFDGRHLPAKAKEESSRRAERKKNKATAAQLIQAGQQSKAWRYMAASIDITHSMALELIKACRKINVDCIVAPYEADAQLAYLNLNDYVDCVITEDSDLILFGCHQVLFKLQKTGEAVLYRKEKLADALKIAPHVFTFNLFRRICILSGCDYLPSLPGIGLAKALKFVIRTRDLLFEKALYDIGKYLNMPKLHVNEEYVKEFFKAEATFLYQYVYDPASRKIVRMTEMESDFPKNLLVASGEFIDDTEALQHALGNIDPFSKKVMDRWNPDLEKLKKNSIWKKTNHDEPQESNFDSTSIKPAFEIKATNMKILDDCDDSPIESINDILNEYKLKDPNPQIKEETKKRKSTTPDTNDRKRVKVFPTKFVSPVKSLQTPTSPILTPTSPILSSKTSSIRSKFLSKLNKNEHRNEPSDLTSSFFTQVKNCVLYANVEPKEEIETPLSEAEDYSPSCSQNSEIENENTTNIIEENKFDGYKHRVRKASWKSPVKIDSSPVKNISVLQSPSPKKILTGNKSHTKLIAARRQGLSRNQKNNTSSDTSQKLLTQFGFLKKQQLKL